MRRRWGCSRPTPSRSRTEPSRHTTTEPDETSGPFAYAERSATEDRTEQSPWAGRNCIPSSPRPIHSRSALSSSKKTAACNLARDTSIASRCRKRRLSRDAPCDRNRILSRIPTTGTTPQPPDLPTGQKASQPFRTGIVPGTTRKHANGPRLPCRGHRPSSRMVCTTPEPGFYSGPTPRLQRLTPARRKAGTGDQAGP